VYSYLTLAVRLQGRSPHCFALDDRPLPPWFYVDSRSLMRFAFVWPPPGFLSSDFFGQVTLTPATTTDLQGITYFRGETAAGLTGGSLSEPFWALNEVFGGEEFRLESTADLSKLPESWAGKKLVVLSRSKLSLTGGKTGEVSNRRLGRWYYCAISPLPANDAVHLQSDPAEKIYVAISVFPAWLSLRKL